MKKITPLKSLSLLITLFCAVSFGFGQSEIIISQYIETDSGTTPKGIEIFNISGADITFTAGNNLEIYQGTNGGACVNLPGTNITSGTLLADEVWVIGTSNLTSFAITNGTNLSGTTDYTFMFNGNDALELYLGGTIQDAFGTCGTDPVTSWTGGGVTTMDNNLQIIDGLCAGDINGWTDPSERFTQIANGSTMTGFGNAPAVCTCPATIWNGTWSNGLPNSTAKSVFIKTSYNTSAGNIIACDLTIDVGATLTVSNSTFAEVENNVVVNGNLIVETQGNFVQNDDTGTFTVNAGGLARVNKSTAPKADWFYYTYWSSPVTNETIGSVFPDVDGDRRFWFNAANFVDTNGDDIDDNGDDWQYALSGDTMIPGVGYAVTESRFFFGGSGTADFEGPFNTGDIIVNLDLNVANTGFNWNFIGNPYPSAVDFIAFQAANSSVIDGAAYYWSQSIPPSESNPGNEQSNFSTNDYATFSIVTGPAAGASGIPPTQYIPSGQGIFIPAITSGPATFTNAMRMADATSNSEFFKSSSSKKQSNTNENRLWVNLTSDNGVFNQILVGYVNGGTNGDDGLAYDAPRIISPDYAAVLYSSMNDNNKKYVIQGKDINSINEDELINLGFSTTIDVETIYTLSIAQIEGGFLSNNPIYIKDNLLNELHDLSASDYTFTSEVGEFNDRFEIAFNSAALSTTDVALNSKSLRIIELEDDRVQFTASDNLRIKSVNIFDLLGRQLYSFKGNNPSETYTLSNLSSSIYIAKVELSNGAVVTQKAIKK